jgi:hypothetical protein
LGERKEKRLGELVFGQNGVVTALDYVP